MSELEDKLSTLTPEELDALNNDPELLQSFKTRYGTHGHEILQKVGDFQSNLNQLAPSNILKNIGVASANAPGATQIAANILPGGNPQQIMQGVQNVAQNPAQISQAIDRTAQVNAGQPISPQEQIPGAMGALTGSAIEAANIPNLTKNSLAGNTPFKAAFNNPSLAIPGAADRAGEVLGPVKNAAINASPKLDVEALRGMAKDPKTLADYAVQRLGNLGDHPIGSMSDAELLAYNQALGQMQAQGGVWADRYKNAKDAVQALIQTQNPQLFQKIKEFAQAAGSEMGPSFKFPWMIGALNPAEGAIKAGVSAGLSAGGQRMLGAGAGLATRHAGQISAILDAYERLTKKKGQ